MSLHAELSPEALQRLHAQRRNSSISSIVIAALVVVLIALSLGIFLLPEIIKETPTIVTYESNVTEETEVQQKKVTTSTERKPSSPSSNLAKVITANTSSPTSVPVPDVDVSTPSIDFGDNTDFGSGWGDGASSDGGFGSIPATMKKRCSKEDRLARLQETGGTPECDAAVTKALNWFKATQSADGSWANARQPAMTGFALLAFLGHCETPLSKDYGDNVLRAMTYLINLGMKNNGKLSLNVVDDHWPYEHSIATYALAEAATFCKQGNINVPNLFEVTQKAGQLIIANQNKNGGWAYSYALDEGHTDLSISAWHLQALKACLHTGLEFKGLETCANKGIRYVNSMQCRDGGLAYAAPDETPHAEGYRTMTGGGVLCLQMWDKGGSSGVRQGVDYIKKNTKFDYNTQFCDLYGHYYEAQVMINTGGETWKNYNAIFRDQLLKNQAPDGSWNKPGGGKPPRAVAPEWVDNNTYRTALCTLMLEVYYRFLPGTGVHSK